MIMYEYEIGFARWKMAAQRATLWILMLNKLTLARPRISFFVLLGHIDRKKVYNLMTSRCRLIVASTATRALGLMIQFPMSCLRPKSCKIIHLLEDKDDCKLISDP